MFHVVFHHATACTVCKCKKSDQSYNHIEFTPLVIYNESHELYCAVFISRNTALIRWQ